MTNRLLKNRKLTVYPDTYCTCNLADMSIHTLLSGLLLLRTALVTGKKHSQSLADAVCVVAPNHQHRRHDGKQEVL